MQFTIKPNAENPDWPTKPDPELLAACMKSAKDKKAAKALALVKTQEQAAVAARQGCSSMNLDWLAMVKNLRQTVRSVAARLDGYEDRTFSWIDGQCPDVAGVLTVTASFRYQAWSLGIDGNNYRYCYVTFEVTNA